MKLIVTIIQCKRVALPYIFLKASLPKLKEAFPGQVVAYLIQHTSGIPRASPLATSALPQLHSERVAHWTSEGRFSDATVVPVTSEYSAYPHLPSVRTAAATALAEGADLHLWLEDDAIVYEASSEHWLGTIPSHGVGAFKRKDEGYINAAYYVSTPEFDKRLLECASDERLWDLSQSLFLPNSLPRIVNLQAHRLEAHIARISGGRVAYLDEGAAERFNTSDRASTLRLLDLLTAIYPGYESILSLDFDLRPYIGFPE